MFDLPRTSVVALVSLLSVWSLGCQQETTEQDVSEARQDAQKEQQDVQEAKRDANKKVAEEAREAREERTYRPSLDKENQDVQEARREGAREIREEQQEASDARQQLRETERKFASEQSRKDYVSQVEGRLTEADGMIERLKAEADSAAQVRKTTLQGKIDAIQQHRGHVDDKLDELKSADANGWHQKHAAVDRALQDLSNAMKMAE